LAEKLTQRDTLRPELEARTMAESSAKDLHQSLATSRIKMFGDKSVEETEIAFNTKLKQTRTSKEDAVQKHQSATHLLTTTANRLREETATLEEARVQQSNVEKSLLDLAISASFSGIAEVESSILESAVVGAFEEQETSLQTRSVALQTKLGQLTRDVENLPAGAVEDAPKLAEIEAENFAKKAAHSTLQAERAVLQDQLNHDSAERQRHEAMASHIQSAELDKERWGKLSQMIGSASGLSFSKFAQGLTLERLVVLANQHLKQLGPRYSLRRDDKKADELELEIVDHYQADAMRSMQSLSGGESFLASLALALGLSELAGGRSPIDSLFIDEGFGTLDADTLEVAMSALENLRATGKTIGVISHVEAMKERITTQIRVIKTDGGGGRLELVS
jgi:exonuclease SbcC